MSAPLRVLIVEDEIINAMGLALELREAGCDVIETVTTGEAAVKTAAAKRPDVILMDIRLGGKIDGLEAARRIRARRSIPVIFMTGYPNREFVDKARALDALGYLVKPLPMPDLLTLLERVPRRP